MNYVLKWRSKPYSAHCYVILCPINHDLKVKMHNNGDKVESIVIPWINSRLLGVHVFLPTRVTELLTTRPPKSSITPQVYSPSWFGETIVSWLPEKIKGMISTPFLKNTGLVTSSLVVAFLQNNVTKTCKGLVMLKTSSCCPDTRVKRAQRQRWIIIELSLHSEKKRSFPAEKNYQRNYCTIA